MADEIKAILFDYDGVISPISRGIFTTSQHVADKTGLDYETILETYLEFVPRLEIGEITEDDMWPEFTKKLGKEFDMNILVEGFTAGSVNDEMIDLAKKLKKMKIKTGIVTSNSAMRSDALVKEFKLDKYYDPIITGAKVGAAKGGEYAGVEIFEAALKPLKLLPEQIIFIDNMEENLSLPADMGFHTYHFDADLADMLALKIYLSGFGIMV